MNATVLTAIGCALICFGSSIGAAAPRDGQTGMVVYPCYFLGGVASLWAILMALVSGITWSGVLTTAILDSIAIGSVVWCFRVVNNS